ncbi:MAG: OsmC family protein [Pirellula sp.]
MMISVEIQWRRGDAVFTDNKYSRCHVWEFDGGAQVRASSSPHIVPLPMSDPHAVDPEEAFVASLSSCHMLCFLSIAAKQNFIVDDYRDDAIGQMGRNSDGKLVMTLVELRPAIRWSSSRVPTDAEIRDMHHQAHEECFIANSVKTEVRVFPAL